VQTGSRHQQTEDLNFLFPNHGEEDEKNLLATIEIAKAQQKDQELKVYYKQNEKNTKRGHVFSTY
jgi:hypothetical protein